MWALAMSGKAKNSPVQSLTYLETLQHFFSVRVQAVPQQSLVLCYSLKVWSDMYLLPTSTVLLGLLCCKGVCHIFGCGYVFMRPNLFSVRSSLAAYLNIYRYIKYGQINQCQGSQKLCLAIKTYCVLRYVFSFSFWWFYQLQTAFIHTETKER